MAKILDSTSCSERIIITTSLLCGLERMFIKQLECLQRKANSIWGGILLLRGEILTCGKSVSFLCSDAGESRETRQLQKCSMCEIKRVTKSAQFLRFFSSYHTDMRILEKIFPRATSVLRSGFVVTDGSKGHVSGRSVTDTWSRLWLQRTGSKICL